MRDLFKLILASSLILFAGAVFAHEENEEEEEDVVEPWEGSGEFGFVGTSGNTESTAWNMRLNFIRHGERWRHRFTGTALVKSEDGIKDNER